MTIIIMCSTGGTSLDGILQSDLRKHVQMVVSDKADALILKKAQKYGIQTYVQSIKGFSREEVDMATASVLLKEGADLILMNGYMRIVSKSFIDAFKGKILNIHPSLLPKHAGLMDLDVHNSVLQSKDTKSGCTIHHVVEDVDSGENILQLQCDVEKSDTAETLKTKVQALESQAWVDIITDYTKGKKQ